MSGLFNLKVLHSHYETAAFRDSPLLEQRSTTPTATTDEGRWNFMLKPEPGALLLVTNLHGEYPACLAMPLSYSKKEKASSNAIYKCGNPDQEHREMPIAQLIDTPFTALTKNQEPRYTKPTPTLGVQYAKPRPRLDNAP